ncbi:MAG: class I SAM-dependent methyltransferase [Candidatus Nomurabacteria bacterium]|jgi:ubiquinone/menaquinone biosynthesis C-methylase UbiE|nr:class I SAM-dependent methyltransferase [Candidatus Nomurabacteria bacterium]
MKDQQTIVNNARDYYSRFGTWFGYTLVLGRAQHFGRYNAEHRTEKLAQRNALEQFARVLAPRKSDKILDAGCGQGVVAHYLAEHYEAEVTGITVTPHEVDVATKLARHRSLRGTTQFELGDFEKLRFKDGTFDKVFTYETLAHAQDVERAAKELFRVLKSGGKAVFVEYEWDYDKFTAEYQKTFDFVCKYWGGFGVRQFGKGEFAKKLRKAGFVKISELDVTAEVRPSMKRVKKLTAPLRFLVGWNEHLAKHFANNAGGNFYEDAVALRAFRYKVYVARKEAK